MFHLFGGFYGGDSHLDDVPAFAYLEGIPQCAYPPGFDTQASPVYPLIAAGYGAVVGSGSRRPFPHTTAGCRNMGTAIELWTFRWTDQRILWAGMVGWASLLAGFVALLRASGRGRSGWEAMSVVLLALIPQVAVTLTGYFHPEDLLVLGVLLGGLAALRRERWMLGGALFGVALMTKQYALLVLIPVVIAAPRRGWARFVGATVGAAAVIAVPILALSGSGAASAMIGAGATPKRTGTTLDLLGLSGLPLTALSRGLPILLIVLVALSARRRLGDRLFDTVPLLSLVAVSLALRLVFEVVLFDYYLVGTAVALWALDCCAGRIRPSTVAWIVGAFYLVPRPVVLFTPLGRYPVEIQALVAISGVAIAASPLWRAGRSTGDPVGSEVRTESSVEATPRVH